MVERLYENLEVPPFSSHEDLKKAYRKLAKRYHPDKNTSPGAMQKFRQIEESYRVLTKLTTEEVIFLSKRQKENQKKHNYSYTRNTSQSYQSSFNTYRYRKRETKENARKVDKYIFIIKMVVIVSLVYPAFLASSAIFGLNPDSPNYIVFGLCLTSTWIALFFIGLFIKFEKRK